MREYIRNKKREVKQHFGWQNYVDHPAHLTLFCSDMNEEETWIDLLNQLNHRPLQISCQDFRVFHNDPLCDGADTLTLEINSTQLHQLQFDIANVLKPFTGKCVTKFLNPAMQESWNTFGFPFVGKHWIPHMTIASIDTPYSLAYIKKTTTETINFDFQCTALSVWKIVGESHTKLKEIELT